MILKNYHISNRDSEPDKACYSFRLKSLTVLPETVPLLKRVLKDGTYRFCRDPFEYDNEEILRHAGNIVESNFYGRNISIQAIVGENGSGKSSILDMIYRIINNFSYFLMREIKTTHASTPLAFIGGLFADLVYEVEGEECTLLSRGNELALRTSDKNYRVGQDIVKDWRRYEDVTGAKMEKIREVMQNFFYTIVTNFAFNSFLTSDYADETTIDKHGTSWIDSLFNKNDGYRVPIVLNPYRYNGQLDVQKETNFAVSRTIAILEFYKKRNWQFIDGYSLDRVTYDYDPHPFLAQFRNTLDNDQKSYLRNIGENESQERELAEYENIIRKKFLDAFNKKNSYANILCRHYGVVPDTENEIYFMACCYLVYKTFAISENYELYSRYSEFGRSSACFETIEMNRHSAGMSENMLKEFVAELNADKSHITYKLRLALLFLKAKDSRGFASNIRQSGFSFSEYMGFLDIQDLPDRVERITELLPMPLFKANILLQKTDSRGRAVSSPTVSFTSLSSGEKLFVYTLGTIIYHIQNIKSVNTRRIHYRRMNIVMDELELCFHPEMQRRFVEKLVSTIRRLHLNTFCKFNFLLVTHSPFILSDIPQSRILFLKDGRDVGNEININPFGTNINNVLVSNFFLSENGFLGDIAKRKINSLVDYLLSKNEEALGWTMDTAKYFIDYIIGDEVIKHHLQILYDHKPSGR